MKNLKAVVVATKGKSSKWENKCKDQASTFDQEKKTLEEKVAHLLEKKNALEQYIDFLYLEMNEKLAGKSSKQMKLIFSRVSSTIDFHVISFRQSTTSTRS